MNPLPIPPVLAPRRSPLAPGLAPAASLALVLACGPSGEDRRLPEVDRALGSIAATCAASTDDVHVKRRELEFWEPAGVGATFLPGDWVRTGRVAFAHVAFVRGGGIELEENTVAIIDVAAPAPGDETAAEPEVVVALETGAVRATLEPRAPGQRPRRLTLRAPDGSRARLGATPEGGRVELRLALIEDRAEIAVRQGRAQVSLQGVEQVVAAGQSTDVAGGRLGEVQQMIASPELAAPPSDARMAFRSGVRATLSWRPLGVARSYRVQVARDASFETLADSRETERTAFEFAPSRPGAYQWRVAARDERGRAGDFGRSRRIFFDVAPPRDRLSAPADGATFGFVRNPPRIALTWEPVSGAERYRVVVARGTDLWADTVVDQITTRPRFEVETLAAGTFYWGVYVHGEELDPLFARPRKIGVKKLGKPPIRASEIQRWGEGR